MLLNMTSKQITPFSIADILKKTATQDELVGDLDKDIRNGDNRKHKLEDIRKRKYREDDEEGKLINAKESPYVDYNSLRNLIISSKTYPEDEFHSVQTACYSQHDNYNLPNTDEYIRLPSSRKSAFDERYLYERDFEDLLRQQKRIHSAFVPKRYILDDYHVSDYNTTTEHSECQSGNLCADKYYQTLRQIKTNYYNLSNISDNIRQLSENGYAKSDYYSESRFTSSNRASPPSRSMYNPMSPRYFLRSPPPLKKNEVRDIPSPTRQDYKVAQGKDGFHNISISLHFTSLFVEEGKGEVF